MKKGRLWCAQGLPYLFRIAIPIVAMSSVGKGRSNALAQGRYRWHTWTGKD